MLVKVSGQPLSTYLPASTFANAANMGLPLALFAFGQRGLALAIAYFAVHAVFTFTIVLTLAARGFSLREALFSPLVWAAGDALSVTGTTLARAAHVSAASPFR